MSQDKPMQFTDFVVETRNPKALDETLNHLGAALVEDGDGTFKGYLQVDGHYVMRVFGDPGFVTFACANQGYCKIVRKLEKRNG